MSEFYCVACGADDGSHYSTCPAWWMPFPDRSKLVVPHPLRNRSYQANPMSNTPDPFKWNPVVQDAGFRFNDCVTVPDQNKPGEIITGYITALLGGRRAVIRTGRAQYRLANLAEVCMATRTPGGQARG